jgi:G:T-mismatch repair DNA endonuclease (very short patch repair protein)
MRSPKQNFSRQCPTCNKIIWYSSKSSLNRAGNKPCQSCFISSMWNREDSPLRKEETRLKRNASISKARQDPTSAYNTQEYIDKQSAAKKAIRNILPSYTSDEYKIKQSEALKKVWQTEEYRNKRLASETMATVAAKAAVWMKENYSSFIASLKLSWTDDRRNKTRDRFLKLLESDDFKEKLWGNQKSVRVSKLELKIKDQLDKFGYIHSSVHKKYFGRCLPDFLNEETKTIIEVYGDYWHCNPSHKTYGNPEWYHPKLKMFSADKWASDFIRNQNIQDQGYKIIVLWESDVEAHNYDVSKLIGNYYHEQEKRDTQGQP